MEGEETQEGLEERKGRDRRYKGRGKRWRSGGRGGGRALRVPTS